MPAQAEVREKILSILTEQAVLAPGEITLQSRPEDLGIDSLGLVEAIYALEDTFGIQIPYDANDPLRSGIDIATVGGIVGEIERLVAARGGTGGAGGGSYSAGATGTSSES